MQEWYSHHGGNHPVLVAEISEEPDGAGTDDLDSTKVGASAVIGWVSLSRWSDRRAYDATAELSLYVHESYRGRGVGGKLMARALEAASAAGLHTVISRIAGENEASIRLHEHVGFSKIGTMREVGLKFGRLLDVHLYQLILAPKGIG